MWNSGVGDHSDDFQNALYGELGNSDEEMDEKYLKEELLFSEDEIDHDDDSSCPSPQLVSPMTRRPSKEPSRDRSRSRSPLQKIELCSVFVPVYDEDDTPFTADFAPDSHILYGSAECVNESSVDRANSRGRSLRGRARSGRGGRLGNRGQGRARGRGRLHHHAWQSGQPLQEIFITDEDVPPELREMLRDLVKRRQERHEVAKDDVFYDAIDHHFAWLPMESFQSVEETFTPEHTGSVSSFTNPYDAFRSFWDDNILQVIVEETNRYANQITSATFQAGWHATNAHELLCLFAFWMMAGIIRMPTISSYFTNNPLLKTDVFSRITSLKRYTNLNRALHFVHTSPNLTNDNAAGPDPMYCLNPIIDHLNAKFQANYVMSKNISIDESSNLWKGRLRFKEHFRSKASKFGIKTFELCESATGYLWSFLVDTGRDGSLERGLAKSTTVVLKLIKPLLNKGYRLFMDNWFNSPLLARYLKRNGTDCVGTLRASLVDVPRLVTHAPLKQGQLIARHSGDVCVLSWLDKKRINMISTCHGSASGLAHISSHAPARPEPFKPQSVLDYNRSMGGVDLKDQMLEPYLLERKRCAKWYLKLFKRLLNCSIHNARILLESSLQTRQDNLKFRLELVHAILSRHHSFIPKSRRAEASYSRTAPFSNIVHHTHWPIRIPQSEIDRAKNSQSRKRCVVCLWEGRKQQKTPYQCEDCSVPLCVETCFKKYHSESS